MGESAVFLLVPEEVDKPSAGPLTEEDFLIASEEEISESLTDLERDFDPPCLEAPLAASAFGFPGLEILQ
jgi:hypothetical protein